MDKPGDAELRHQLEELRSRIRPKADEATKPKEPKMSNRHTRNNTGLEDYSNSQLTAKLDSSRTQAEIAQCVQEIQNRLSKYRETHGHITLEVLNRLEVEYQKYHQNSNGYGFVDQDEPEYEPAPPPPPPPPHRTPEPLNRAIIRTIEENQCEYGPYLKEIYESDWDYKDRRVGNKHMDADEWKAKDFVLSHKDDINGTRSTLSVSQYGIMILLLKAYMGHKEHPEWQANAAPF